MDHRPRLEARIGDIVMRNPVMTASGTFGYAVEFASLLDVNRLGAVIVKGVSLEPSPGNPPPRVVETPCGMLNAIGLENPGIDAFLTQKLPQLDHLQPPLICNIYGKTVEEYGELAARLDAVDKVRGLEVNISCPNVKAGGVAFGVDAASAARVVRQVRKNTTKCVIAKLSPNVTDVTAIARSVEEAGADGVSLINTLTGMAIDLGTRRPVLANITGGLSGPAIKPIALRMVWETAKAVAIPVVGVGGIMTAQDALEFLLAGACAVQVGTANFVDPGATVRIVEGIESFFLDNHVQDIKDFVGALRV